MVAGLKRGRTGWLFAACVAVCAAQTFSPPAPLIAPAPPTTILEADSAAAKVVSLTGQVSVLRNSYPWALDVGDSVETKQIILTGADGFAVFQLSDGSTFQVFPNSRVTFRSNPGDWKDLLDLWIGRVKVYIQKLGNQPNPNRIFTPTAVISVRGTTFDVVVEDEKDTTLVSVDEGQVLVRHRLIGYSKDKVLTAGEYLRVYKDAPIAKNFDKERVVQRGLRAAAEALYTIILQSGGPAGPGAPGSGGGGPTVPGDTGGGSSDGGSTTPGGGNVPLPPPPPPPPPSG
ncbi:MAG: FecR domain-containing protein [Bryobacteraceae bacterium]|nr:FecR domain-containing protein [Bryobacteraceae bacterium]